MASEPGRVRRFFSFLLRVIDGTRRIALNVLFLLIVAFVLVAWFGGSRLKIDSDTALVLNLQGDLVEQYTGSTYEVMLADTLGEGPRETRLRDVLDALDAATHDKRITRVVLVLDDMDGASTASLNEIVAALARLRASGKPVLAWGSSFSQPQYFLAAHADQVYLHPHGTVDVRGIGGNSLYFKDVLDKLGVTVHTFQAGKYKSAIEPFTRTGPSPEALEADQFWLNDIWATWTESVEQARKLPAGEIHRIINDLPKRLAAAHGDIAHLALTAKLVDGLLTRDEFSAQLIEEGAPLDEKEGTFRQVALAQYAGQIAEARGDSVAVVVAQGEIIDDDAPPGALGCRSTAELLRRAREDETIKALVLRVNSPGGSVFGSELVRREVELTEEAGKPVLASFCGAASSTGEWIAMDADEIFADPATITGSIGVFGMLPTFEKTLDKGGIGRGGAATTWLANASDPTRPLDKRMAHGLQMSVADTYGKFITGVAAGRDSTPEKIHEIAQGRVWSGRQALERGLVDTLGGLKDALDTAAERGGLGESYRVAYIDPQPPGIDRYLSLLFSTFVRSAHNQFGAQLSSWLPPLARNVQTSLRLFESARAHPLRVYAFCFCSAP